MECGAERFSSAKEVKAKKHCRAPALQGFTGEAL